MGGDRPYGLAIGAVVVAAMVALPFLIVPAFYVFANMYAIVAGTDFSSDTIDVGAFLAGLLLTVTFLLLGMAAVVSLIGRALSPKRREP
jgi:hypothetical protein